MDKRISKRSFARSFLKKALFAVLFVVVTLLLLLGYILIEDRKYEPYEFDGIKPEHRLGILITWKSNGAQDTWGLYQSKLAPALKSLHSSGAVSLVLPFAHKAMKHPKHSARWDHSVFVLLDGSNTQRERSQDIYALTQSQPFLDSLRSVDLLRLQNGLDLFYPMEQGLSRESKLNQSLEFVFSKPETRSKYYQDQYVWSGPAMADLHHRDKAGRFIGFEVEKRLYGTTEMPAWDLVHIFGFTPWQFLKASPVFMSTWNKHAKRVFGPDATFKSVIKGWDQLRIKLQEEAEQNLDLTLQETQKAPHL